MTNISSYDVTFRQVYPNQLGGTYDPDTKLFDVDGYAIPIAPLDFPDYPSITINNCTTTVLFTDKSSSIFKGEAVAYVYADDVQYFSEEAQFIFKTYRPFIREIDGVSYYAFVMAYCSMYTFTATENSFSRSYTFTYNSTTALNTFGYCLYGINYINQGDYVPCTFMRANSEIVNSPYLHFYGNYGQYFGNYENGFSTDDSFSFGTWLYNLGRGLTLNASTFVDILNTDILGYSLLEILFGGGFIVYVSYTIIKWLLPV